MSDRAASHGAHSVADAMAVAPQDGCGEDALQPSSSRRAEGFFAQNRALRSRIEELEQENRLLKERTAYVQNVSRTYREKVASLLCEMKQQRQGNGAVGPAKAPLLASTPRCRGADRESCDHPSPAPRSPGRDSASAESLEALAQRLRESSLRRKRPVVGLNGGESDDGLLRSTSNTSHSSAREEPPVVDPQDCGNEDKVSQSSSPNLRRGRGGTAPGSPASGHTSTVRRGAIERLMAEKRNLQSLVDTMKVQINMLSRQNVEKGRNPRGGPREEQGEPTQKSREPKAKASPHLRTTVGSSGTPAVDGPASAEPLPDPRMEKLVVVLLQRQKELEEQVRTLSASADHFTREIAHYKVLLDQKRAEMATVVSREALVTRLANQTNVELTESTERVKLLEKQLRISRLREGRNKSFSAVRTMAQTPAVQSSREEESLAVQALKARLHSRETMLSELEVANSKLEARLGLSQAAWALAFDNVAAESHALLGCLLRERAAVMAVAQKQLGIRAGYSRFDPSHRCEWEGNELRSCELDSCTLSAAERGEDPAALPTSSPVVPKMLEKLISAQHPPMRDTAVETDSPVLISLATTTSPSIDYTKRVRHDQGVETNSPVLISSGVGTTPSLVMRHDPQYSFLPLLVLPSAQPAAVTDPIEASVASQPSTSGTGEPQLVKKAAVVPYPRACDPSACASKSSSPVGEERAMETETQPANGDLTLREQPAAPPKGLSNASNNSCARGVGTLGDHAAVPSCDTPASERVDPGDPSAPLAEVAEPWLCDTLLTAKSLKGSLPIAASEFQFGSSIDDDEPPHFPYEGPSESHLAS